MKKYLILFVCVFLMCSATAHASPANCDDDMTPEELQIEEVCSWHVGCALVTKVQKSCVKLKNFLSRLGQLGQRSAAKENIEQDSESPSQIQVKRNLFGKLKIQFTDDQVSEALAETYQVPRSNIGACLIERDADKCMELLNGGPKIPAPQEQADEIARRLIDMTIGIKSEQGGLEMSKSGLKRCELVTSETSPMAYEEAEKICTGTTKAAIAFCNGNKADYDKERAKLQALIDRGGVTNNIYKKLASKPYPECPTTLPDSGKTIEAALEEYKKRFASKLEDEAKKSLDLARSAYEDVKGRYDSPEKKGSDAEKAKDLEKLRTMKSFLEAHEYKLSSGTKGGSEKLSSGMLKLMVDIDSLMAVINTKEEEYVALPRRGSAAATNALHAALDQSGDTRRELSDQERAAIAQQTGMLTPVLGAMQDYAQVLDAQAAAEQQRAIELQQNAQREQARRQAEMQRQRRAQNIREQEALIRGREENIARAQAQNREAELFNQRAYRQQQELEAAAIRERINDEAEQQRIENERMQKQIEAIRKAKEEEGKYYPPLTCAATVIKRDNNGNTRECFQNNCGRTIVAYGPRAMTHIKAGEAACGFKYYWACERGNDKGVLAGDSYYEDRHMCKR